MSWDESGGVSVTKRASQVEQTKADECWAMPWREDGNNAAMPPRRMPYEMITIHSGTLAVGSRVSIASIFLSFHTNLKFNLVLILALVLKALG